MALYGPPDTAAPAIKAIWARVLAETKIAYPLSHPSIVAEAARANISTAEMQMFIAHERYIEERRRLMRQWEDAEPEEEDEEKEDGHNSPSAPRTVSAGVTGVVTGLAGTVIPIIGLTAGIVLQLVRPAALVPYENALDGVVDGSAALVARALFSTR